MIPASPSDEYYLELCKERVEKKLGWGSSSTWSHNDFLEASEIISAATGVNLSVTTIKRLWKKVKFEGSPTTSTLNALALYAGYDNWRHFRLSQPEVRLNEQSGEKGDPNEVEKSPLPSTVPFTANRKVKGFLIPLVLALLLLTTMLSLFRAKEKSVVMPDPGKIVFNSEPVAKGLPNTIVFNYDISAAAVDSAFIQQTWDPQRRVRITKEGRQRTAIYYYPGHFRAKLVLNDQIVKEHGLLIPTEGWLGIVDREPIPVYIPSGQLLLNGTLHASAKVLEEGKVNTRDREFWLTYSNVRDFGLDGDDFTLETSLKNNLEEGGFTCQDAYLVIDGDAGMMWLPFSAPGCVSNLSLRLGEVLVSGKEANLSAFGVDLSGWNRVKCTVKNRTLSLMVNDKLIYSHAYKESIGRIMGVNLRFRGAGSVDYLRLSDASRRLVYDDEM